MWRICEIKGVVEQMGGHKDLMDFFALLSLILIFIFLKFTLT